MTVLVLALFAGFTSVGTLAVFTDQESVTGNVFNTGTIDLTLDKSTALVTVASGMMPGDSTAVSPLVITNAAGSGALRYSITATATNTDTKALKDALVLTIRQGDLATPTSCAAATGALVYSGDLDKDATYSPTVAGKLIGDPAQFDQGDRPLAVGASETLCFKVSLPIGAPSTVKLATTTATFTFDAEQTVNN